MKTLLNVDFFDEVQGIPDNLYDFLLADPPYDMKKTLVDIFLREARRICKGNIIVFCKPENQFFKPDEYAFWAKPPSPKNNTKNLSRCVDMILIQRGPTFNGMDVSWRSRANWWTDTLDEPQVHEFQKPRSLLERLIRLYSKKGDKGLDPFAGSFMSGVAAKNLGRNLEGFEIKASHVEAFYARNPVQIDHSWKEASQDLKARFGNQ